MAAGVRGDARSTARHTDPQRARMNDTTAIQDALKELSLTADERAACAALVGVRTLGDLKAVLERGEVGKELAAKLRKVLK